MNSIEKEIELRSDHKIRQNKMNKDWLDIQRGTVSDNAQIFNKPKKIKESVFDFVCIG